ncbi:TonB-dependent receptor [Maribellus comscasis]|uniref:TonB-dependent receptor n=1 Tax=Maribellus comscasis TaxID=2681766 RepID=A0A6I6K577_9BACT|nr:TonB-dependent receptor [Maribellus comscasis]QGY46783.1 TonB-dependent receptor [Maribellus comscasis]
MDKLTTAIYFLIVTSGFLFSGSHVFSQTDSTTFYTRSLYQLSQTKIASEKKTEQTISKASTTIRVVTKEQIEAGAYLTLEDILVGLPGFQFRDIMGLNSYSFLRGLPRQNNSILVYIDGVQINELNSGGYYGGGQYNLANVERIEIMYGPASVIYGTNAISGVINIITKNPGKGESLLASVGAGAFNTYQTDITYSNSNDRLGLQLSAMYKTTEKANLTNGNNDNYWDDDLEIFETDYAFDAKLILKNLTFGVNYQNRRSSTTSYNPSVNTIYKGFGTLWNLQLVNTYAKHNKLFSDKVEWNTTLYNRNATVLANSVKEVTDTGQIGYYRPNNLLGVESFLEVKPSEDFSIVTGFLSQYENLAKGYSTTSSNEYYIQPRKPKSPDQTSDFLAGIFLQLDYSFQKYWQFTVGSRYEYSTSYREVFTPRASLLFNKNKYSGKLIFAQAFRAPKPWDFTDGIGNPGLDPEKFRSFEISNTLFITDNFKTDLQIYYNRLYNGIVKVYAADNADFYWNNSGNTETKGMELSTNLVHNNVNFFGSYTYNLTADKNGEQVAEIAPHTGVLGANYSFSKHLNVGLRTFYFGKRKNPKVIKATNSEYIEPAVVVDLNISLLNYKNKNIQFVLKNLTNKEYYHTSNLIPDRYRQAQRFFLLKLSYKIEKL